MDQEITEQQQAGGQLATWKRLYAADWEQAFNEFMFLMAEQYSLELLVEAGGEQVPSPMVRLWRESLQDLSPHQMREGLKGYMASERRHFKPTPEDIKENSLDIEAWDKPRRRTKRDCPMCNGSSWRDAKGRPWREVNGSNAAGMVRCDCSVVHYAGQEFPGPKFQLPPASFEEEIPVPEITLPAKPMPAEMSEAEYQERQKLLRQQAERLTKGEAPLSK